MAPCFLLSGLLAAIGAAADGGSSGPDAPAPELVRLDEDLADIQRAKEQGRIGPEKYQAFLTRFRAEFDAFNLRTPPVPADVKLHARILSRLGENGRAAANLTQVLQRDPENIDLRVALGQVHLDGKNYPAALAEADAILKRDPTNKAALALKYSSAGRAAPGRDRSEVSTMAADERSTVRNRLSETAVPATRNFSHKVAVVPPDPLAEQKKPEPARPNPLVPLAEAAGLGILAYGVSRSKASYESAEGFDEEHRPPYGRGQQFVAGAVIAGLVGAGVYFAGVAAVAAAPALSRQVASIGNQGMRLAQSEAGAINPIAAKVNGRANAVAPQVEGAASQVEQIVIKKGEILNRVWHSEWKPNSEILSGPEGLSYCRGSCLPINAASAIENRGLTVGVVNNAQRGGLYRATEDIVVTVRRSLGGSDQEVLLRSRADISKLQLVNDSLSSIPPGK